MSQFDRNKDYYGVLGVDKEASRNEIDRQYKRQAAKHHPDRGGSEEQMKSLNEAYGVLKDSTARRAYDDSQTTTAHSRTTGSGLSDFVPVSSPPARDIGALGQCLNAGLCLAAGLFLLLLVRTQWMWFLWPLAILAVFVVAFGVLMARSAMVAMNESLPKTNRLKRHTKLQEIAFWTVIVSTGYGLYWLLSY
ncbi:MAG TPA: J domain-containing protein [Pyrinomonadaceae bacterium]